MLIDSKGGVRLFSDVWSKNAALFKRLMKIHSNPPILHYGFMDIWMCQCLMTLMLTHLLVGPLAGLHPTLIEGEVILEEVEQQVPQHPCLLQVILQVLINSERTHTLSCDGAQDWQVLLRKKQRI